MAICRNVQLSFWTDNKIDGDFTPEDKYFYLYLLTNPKTNICGCYEINHSQIMNQTGYSKDTINRLLERFENVHKIIKYDQTTKEILILNWNKYNWNKSEKTLKGIENVVKHIKSDAFKRYVTDLVNSIRNKDECVTVTYPIGVSNTNKKDIDIIKNIVDYLNNKCGTRYRYNTPNTVKHIKARLNDGYLETDFYTVIDKKADEWLGTSQERYLRPETLFGTKFEGYLNQKIVNDRKNNNYIDRISNRVSEVDSW